MNTNGRLIPYMRKSSGEDPEGSLARQRGAIRRWADANEVELAAEVWEPGVSGKKNWRERGLGAALKAVERGEAAGIIVEEQSRLSRENMRATAEVWEALQAVDARLVCAAEGIDTARGDHELSFAVRAALAREQWKQYARRMADVKERKLREGIALGPTPVGYRKRADKRIELDPQTAPAVREMFERWASGEGRIRLAAFLDERAPKANGRKWSKTAVSFIIRNPIYYTGRLHYGDLSSDWDAGAVVDAPLWHACQRPKSNARIRSPHWLLSGLATCAACGLRLEPVVTTGGTPRKYRYYRCTNRNCTSRAGAAAKQLERLAYLQTLAVEGDIETRASAPDMTRLEEALVKAERRLSQVMIDGAADDLGELWAPEVRRRREARNEAAANLGVARQEAGVSSGEVQLAEAWDGLSAVDRRAAIALFWKEIRVGRRKDGAQAITFVARGPGGETEIDLTGPSRGEQ